MITHHDTIITSEILVTQNLDRNVYYEAAVGVTDGKVSFIGYQANLGGHSASENIRLDNALVMPGLINAHTHSAMTFLRGLADDLPLMEWLHNHIFPIEQHLISEIVYLSTQLACAEMLRSGTTCFADMYLLENAVCETISAAGLKLVAGEGLFSFPSPAYATTKEAFRLCDSMIDRWKGHPRIHIAMMPHSIYTTTPGLLQEAHSVARQNGCLLHLHLAETLDETKDCLEQHGTTPIGYCYRLGILDEHTLIAHAVHCSDEDIAVLKQTDTKIVHCPSSNLKLASGFSPVSSMLYQGVRVALGTDGAASNNSLNMFQEMKLCALLHKGLSGDPTQIPAQTALDMATVNGAAALGWPELGSLRLGGPADLIALDISSPNMQPLYNPVSHIVYATSGHEVCFTMIDGRILYTNEGYTTIDYPLLCREMEALKKWVLNKLQ